MEAWEYSENRIGAQDKSMGSPMAGKVFSTTGGSFTSFGGRMQEFGDIVLGSLVLYGLFRRGIPFDQIGFGFVFYLLANGFKLKGE